MKAAEGAVALLGALLIPLFLPLHLLILGGLVVLRSLQLLGDFVAWRQGWGLVGS
jgi:hypothetical protein